MYVIQIMRSVFYTRLGSYLSMTSVTSVTKGQTKAIVSVCPNRSIRRANIDLDGFGGIHFVTVELTERPKVVVTTAYVYSYDVTILEDKLMLTRDAALAQWIRLRIPSCRPGFESQAHHQHFYQFMLDIMKREKENLKVYHKENSFKRNILDCAYLRNGQNYFAFSQDPIIPIMLLHYFPFLRPRDHSTNCATITSLQYIFVNDLYLTKFQCTDIKRKLTTKTKLNP